MFRACRFDLSRDPRLFLSEQLGGNSVVVVELEELAAAFGEVRQRLRRALAGPAGALASIRPAPFHLAPNGRLQLLIAADQAKAQQRSPQQSLGRATGERASSTLVGAPIRRVTLAVLVHAHGPLATAAANTAREQVSSSPLALAEPAMCCLELGLGDDRLMATGVPGPVVEHFA
jgi:hypothetical protein